MIKLAFEAISQCLPETAIMLMDLYRLNNGLGVDDQPILHP